MTKSFTKVLTVGLDVGYGVTKAVALGRETVIFPSVFGYAREIKFRAEDIAAKYPGDKLIDGPTSWFVGALAESQLPPGEQYRLRGRTADEAKIGNVYRLLLAKVALGKLLSDEKSGDVIQIQIATGLPVDHMGDAPELKKALIGQHLIKTDRAEFIAHVVDAIVMPQPYGTIYSKSLTSEGRINREYTHRRTGVVDLGTYTIDITLDDGGEYIDAESGSVESGIHVAQHRIAEALERDYREKPKPRLVDEVLRTGCLKAHGDEVTYRDEVASALEPIRTATLNLMGEKWRGGLEVDVIHIAGGGAPLVETVIKSAYKQAAMVEEPQTANARGYLNYAIWAARHA